MNRRQFLMAGSGLVLGGALSLARGPAAAQRRPNIIVILADDQGYADLGCQGQLADVKTPNIDRLATEGVRFTDGYITAPQCSPSRAGLITGRYQQRFGLNEIPDCPLPLDQATIADRLKGAGYTTGMIGKWHLDPGSQSKVWAEAEGDVEIKPDGNVTVPFEKALPYYPQHRGFSEYFMGQMKRYWANYGLDGASLKPDGEWVESDRYRLDVQSDAAVAFIERNHDKPFFLYMAYFAPHTPLEATEEYLSQFPGEMPERRRHALAMIAAMDRGVGRILDALQRHGIDENTLIVFSSDNGAPLKATMEDSPITGDAGGWDGSRNDPLVGEKGMLAEGGIRVPFVARWNGTIPAGTVYREPIHSLDLGATAVELAGLGKPQELDGVNLIPYLTGEKQGAPHEALYWRFWNQTAIRKGQWKYLQAGGKGRFLFDLASPEHERRDLIEEHPEIAEELRRDMNAWAAQMVNPVGVPDGELNPQEQRWYAHYFGLEG